MQKMNVSRNVDRRNDSLQDPSEFANAESGATPVFMDIDGVHSFKLDRGFVLIDLFVLRSKANSQFSREKVAQLKVPLARFYNFAKSMESQANQLRPVISETKREGHS